MAQHRRSEKDRPSMGNAAIQAGKRVTYSAYKPSKMDWVGDVPEHWEVRRLKYTASINDEALPETTDPDYEFTYVDIGSVDASKGIVATETYRFEDAPSRARRIVREGDTIVSTVRTYLRAIAAIREPAENLIVSTGFAVVRPRSLDPGYLSYALRSPFFVETVVSRSTGVSYPAINAPEVGNIGVTLPPLDEQRAIAAFLDRETARIDGLIEKKQRQIDVLQEKRSALISHAVTKGLDPNAPMKDSGIEWLGQIPEHWGMKCVKYMAKILRGKFTHRPRNDPRMYDGPYPFIQTGDVSSASKYVREYHQTLSEDGFAVSKMFPKGTLVMTIAANIGDMAILDFEACFPDSIVGFVPRRGVALDFLYYLFIGIRPALMSTATLNTQFNLNVDRIGSVVAVQPPLNEQQAIVEHLESQAGQINALMAQINASIVMLREYRSALISVAVTGKIDVRGKVAT
jgi:type I restriction enzyme S subunit